LKDQSSAPNPRPDPRTSVIPEPPLSFERLSGPMPRPPASTRKPRPQPSADKSAVFGDQVTDMMILRIGIASYEQIKARMVAIASGELTPAADEPKAWFPSLKAAANALASPSPEILAAMTVNADHLSQRLFPAPPDSDPKD
jgi:hypothetical protein